MPQRVKLNFIYLFIIGLSAILAIYLGLSYANYKWLIVSYAFLLIAVNLFQNFFSKIGKNLLLGCCSFILMLFVADSFLRLALKPYFYYREHEKFENRMPEYPALLLRYEKNVDFTGEVSGDLTAMSGEFQYKQPRVIRFKTDSKGFRNNPGQETKKNSILVIGDSFGVGTGTDQDSTWVALLSKNNEVYNLSFPGNPLQELANLVVEYDQINHTETPTVVWLLFTGNDQPNMITDYEYKYADLITQNQLKEKGKAGLFKNVFTRAVNYFRKSPIRMLIHRIGLKKNPGVMFRDFHGGKKMFFYEEYAKASRLTSEEIANQSGFETFKKVLSAAKELSAAKKFNLKIVLMPTKFEIYKWVYDGAAPWQEASQPSGFSTLLTSMLGDLGIDFIDAKPFLFNAAAETYNSSNNALWWLDDTHLNTEGHRVFFEFMQNSVLTLGKQSTP